MHKLAICLRQVYPFCERLGVSACHGLSYLQQSAMQPNEMGAENSNAHPVLPEPFAALAGQPAKQTGS